MHARHPRGAGSGWAVKGRKFWAIVGRRFVGYPAVVLCGSTGPVVLGVLPEGLPMTARSLRRVVCAIVAVLSATVSTPAAVTGLQVEFDGYVGGRHVWSVYAVSDTPSHVLLGVIKHNVVSGSMDSVQHNDSTVGAWSPLFTPLGSVTTDSFVTASGQAGPNANTNLDPAFGSGTGSSIPANAGWFNSNPATQPQFGAAGRIKIMQVAGSALQPYQARLEVVYKLEQESTAPLFSALTYTIPGLGCSQSISASSGSLVPFSFSNPRVWKVPVVRCTVS